MKLPSREQCLELAHETYTAIISMPTSATTIDRFTAPATEQQLQALIHRAYKAGAEKALEKAAVNLENSVIGFCSDGEWAEGYLQACRDVVEGIRELKVEDV